MPTNSIIQLNWSHTSVAQLPALESGVVYVVYVPLCVNGKSVLSDSQRLIAIELLSDIQWDRFERRPIGPSKESYLTGRYYLLQLLAQFSKIQPESITLSYNRLNKPFLEPNPQGLEFNFTDTSIARDLRHGGGIESVGLFAFTLKSHVGVDIEAAHRTAASDKIAERRFTAHEHAFYAEGSGVHENGNEERTTKEERFLQIWTRKEAFGKACGLGINFKMNQLNLMASLGAGDTRLDQHAFEYQQQAWRLQQFYGPQNEIACISYAGTQTLAIQALQIDPELDSA